MTFKVLLATGVSCSALMFSAIVGAALAHEAHRHDAPEMAVSADHAPTQTSGDVPLWSDLGPLTFRISTSNAEAQRYFDQGLMLAYGFNHGEARRSFQVAQRLDPSCAMCFWGEALVLGPNINAPMEPSQNAPALAAIARAQALADNASEREKALIAALATRYGSDVVANRAQLDAAYADAMVEASRRFADDLDIATLAAESLMDLSPWDYWAPGGREPKGRTVEILALLEGVLQRNPDHPGAIHFYIHAVEASARPERAEPHADRLAAQNLGTGHLAHMPSHIYYRVGRYGDSLATNRRAVAVDEAFLAKVQAEGIYAGGYYPHNIHFLMVSAQMAGDGATVLAAAEKLGRAVPDDVARTRAWVQPIKAAPLFAHAQFGTPEAILALPRPTGDMPYVTAMWHYARGVAFAAQKDIPAARAEVETIETMAKQPDIETLTKAGVPAPDVLALAAHIVRGRIAQAGGNLQEVISAFREAVAIEDRLAYMEPPFWYYPVRQSLGAALLAAGEADEARMMFEASLQTAPNNGWALFGLGAVHSAKGDPEAAAAIEGRLAKVWTGPRGILSLDRL
jgi:tetratricopeptide (TPR) repeat protein